MPFPYLLFTLPIFLLSPSINITHISMLYYRFSPKSLPKNGINYFLSQYFSWYYSERFKFKVSACAPISKLYNRFSPKSLPKNGINVYLDIFRGTTQKDKFKVSACEPIELVFRVHHPYTRSTSQHEYHSNTNTTPPTINQHHHPSILSHNNTIHIALQNIPYSLTFYTDFTSTIIINDHRHSSIHNTTASYSLN